MPMNSSDLNDDLPKSFESRLPVSLRNCAKKLSSDDVESDAGELVEFCKRAPCFISEYVGCSFEETKKKLSEHLNGVKIYYNRGDIFDRTYKVSEYVYASLLGAFYYDCLYIWKI